MLLTFFNPQRDGSIVICSVSHMRGCWCRRRFRPPASRCTSSSPCRPSLGSWSCLLSSGWTSWISEDPEEEKRHELREDQTLVMMMMMMKAVPHLQPPTCFLWECHGFSQLEPLLSPTPLLCPWTSEKHRDVTHQIMYSWELSSNDVG